MSKLDPDFTDTRSCFCSALRRAGRAVTQHYEAAFRGTGLRATQFTVLATLAQVEPMTMSDLAELLGMERTTLTRNLRPLEAKGWVRGLADDADLRRRRIELTPKGRAAATRAIPTWRKAQASIGPVLARFGIRFEDPSRAS
jgi:DNA-binding MarR family transcriptional regulator